MPIKKNTATSEGSVTATEKKIPAAKKKAVASAEKNEAVEPAAKKKAAVPATKKKAEITTEKKEAVEPAAKKKAAVPATKKKAVVTAEKNEAVEPAAKKKAAVSVIKKEPAASKKKSLKEPSKSKTAKKGSSTLKNTLDEVEIKCIADAILDKKGSFVCSLDLRPIGTAICDYFVVCNADSSTQVNAIADNIEEMMIKNCSRRVIRKQGKENAFWIILDYANIVVHIFQTEYRQFYRLEDLWADAERTVYQE